MSTTTLNTKFQLRRDTLENWLNSTKGNNPILADGEPVLVDVEGDGAYKLKIGDGETVFSELPYYGGDSGDADWETLLNKPFYEKQIPVRTYTTDFTKIPDATGIDETNTFEVFKISDTAYTAEEMKHLLLNGEGTGVTPFSMIDYSPTDDDLIIEPSSIMFMYHYDPTDLNRWCNLFISVLQDDVTINGIYCENKGLYAFKVTNSYAEWKGTSVTEPAHIELKKIDKKFLHLDWEDIENKPTVQAGVPQIQKMTDYLYYLDINFDLNYDDGLDYIKNHLTPEGPAEGEDDGNCTAFRKNDLVGRNLDWKYAETAEYIINTPATKGRHASIGVATGLTELTNDIAEEGEWNDLYEMLPFCMVDGINDQGVVIECNTVHLSDGTQTIIDDDNNDITLAMIMIPRYVLDYADSAAHAVELLQNVNIYNPPAEAPFDLHYLVADETETYVLEWLSDGEGGYQLEAINLPDEDHHMPISTNFYLYDYFDEGTIVGGGGKNRYDIIAANYEDIETQADAFDVLAKTYSTLVNEITLNERDGSDNHTTHSVVYNIAAKTLAIRPQPDVAEPTDKEFKFAVNNKEWATADWENITNKPFGEVKIPAKILTSDFTSEGVIAGNVDSINLKVVPISNIAYNTEELKNSLFSYTLERNNESAITKEFITLSDESFMATSEYIVIFNENGVENGQPIFVSALQDNVIVEGVNIEKKGFYALQGEINNYATWEGTAIKIPASTMTKQIDTKYINYDWENIENKPFGEIPIEDWEVRMPENPSPEDIIVFEQETSVQNWKITYLGAALSNENFNNLGGLWKTQIITTENNNVSETFVTGSCYMGIDPNSNYSISIYYNNIYAKLVNYINPNYLQGNSNNSYATQQSGLYLLQDVSYDSNTNTFQEIKPIACYASLEDSNNDNSFYTIDYTNANEIYNYEKTPDTVYLIHASDKYLTKEDFYKSKIHIYSEDIQNGSKYVELNVDLSPSMAEVEDFSNLYQEFAEGINILTLDNNSIAFVQENNLNFNGITLKSGTYLTKNVEYCSINGQEESVISYIEPFRIGAKELKIIDKQFLQIPWSHISEPPFGETHIYELEFHGPDDYDRLQNMSNKISLNNIGLSNIEYYKIGDFTSLDSLTLTSSYIEFNLCDDYDENGGIKNEYSYQFLNRKIKNSEFEDMMQDGSIFFLTASNTNWNEVSPMEGLPAIIITTIENAVLQGVTFPEPGIYGAHIWKEATGYDDNKNEVTITKHQWISEWRIDDGDVIKTIDSKYLSGISYPSLSQSPVSFDYILYNDYNNVSNISLNEWANSQSISDEYYYTAIDNVDFDLNEKELFSAQMYYGHTSDQNTIDHQETNYLRNINNFEIYTELISSQNNNQITYATVYYGFQTNNTTSYADFIYVKIDDNNRYYSDNIYYDISNFSNNFSFSGSQSQLYLLRHITQENNSTIYSGIYELRQGDSGSYVKKLSPRLIPSFIKGQNNLSISNIELTPTTNVREPFKFIIENVEKTADYEYEILNYSDGYYSKRIKCVYNNIANTYGLAKVTFVVSETSYLYFQMAGTNDSSGIYVSDLMSLENAECPFSTNDMFENNYYNYATNQIKEFYIECTPGTYVFYIKNRLGNPDTNNDYINIKLCEESTSDSEEVTEQVVSLEQYVKEIINDMFENGNGGSF